MGVDEGNLSVMGVERYILTSSNYGVEIPSSIIFCYLWLESSSLLSATNKQHVYPLKTFLSNRLPRVHLDLMNDACLLER